MHRRSFGARACAHESGGPSGYSEQNWAVQARAGCAAEQQSKDIHRELYREWIRAAQSGTRRHTERGRKGPLDGSGPHGSPHA